MTLGWKNFKKNNGKPSKSFLKVTPLSLSFPNGFGESLIYQAAPVIHRLSSLKKTSDYIICAAC